MSPLAGTRPRWLALAREEARGLLTAKGPWILAGLLVVWGYRPTYVGWQGLGPNQTVGFVQTVGSFLLPLGVLLLSYRSVVGERTSGSLKFVLGLPLTRSDILVGKVLGRSAGLAVPVSAAAVVLGIVGFVRFGIFSPLLFCGVLLATLLYVVTLVSIATAVSAVTTNTVRAAGAVFGGVYLFFTVFWTRFAELIYTFLGGPSTGSFSAPADGLFFALLRLSPGRAYRVLTNWLLGVGNSGAPYDAVITKLETPTSITIYTVESAFGGQTPPAYLHEISGLVVLLVWLVVPLGIARYQFQRGDLV
ncbi:ABC transporter permease subunit [Halohasta litorea]|uniref:ABC transporter permease subunit n=1 Tax=Halohasta litorea TaxID=869891 RepID=A0ABD6DC83_9EURY|nr:ABC transporter permease subunit [Halohasta litorea]